MQSGFDGLPTVQGTYPVATSTIELLAADNALTEGEHYFFYYKMRNSEGDSLPSDVFEVALADYPQAPSAPLKVDSQSSLSSIQVEWQDVAFTEISVIGYELWMDAGMDGFFKIVFDGRNKPGVMSYLAEGLETGRAYQF